jgi:hypothetical protein
MADPKEFNRLKARLRDAILHDDRSTRAERRIGYEIADYLNFGSGDAWPSQAYLAQRSGYSVKSVERATKRLAGTGEHDGLWFRREIDGKGYRYVPKFDRLTPSDTRQNVGRRSPTFATKTPDIRDGGARQNVGLSSLGDPNLEAARDGGHVRHSPAVRNHERMAERDDKSPIGSPDLDQAITTAAVSGGAPRFVFEGSEPWRACRSRLPSARLRLRTERSASNQQLAVRR